MTDAERAMWFQLRGRRLGGFKFKRQWTIGSHVIDFCCIERRIVVEIDGGQHNPTRDALRTSALEAAGYRVVRYWNNEVHENLEGVLTNLLAQLQTGPHHAENGSFSYEPDFRHPLPLAGEGVL